MYLGWWQRCSTNHICNSKSQPSKNQTTTLQDVKTWYIPERAIGTRVLLVCLVKMKAIPAMRRSMFPSSFRNTKVCKNATIKVRLLCDSHLSFFSLLHNPVSWTSNLLGSLYRLCKKIEPFSQICAFHMSNDTQEIQKFMSLGHWTLPLFSQVIPPHSKSQGNLIYDFEQCSFCTRDMIKGVKTDTIFKNKRGDLLLKDSF